MPKYYCDYCDAFLTRDSTKLRKTHNEGRRHKDSVRAFYQNWMENQAQKMIDATARAYSEKRMQGAIPRTTLGLAGPPPVSHFNPHPPRGMMPPQGPYGGVYPPPPHMASRMGAPFAPTPRMVHPEPMRMPGISPPGQTGPKRESAQVKQETPTSVWKKASGGAGSRFQPY